MRFSDANQPLWSPPTSSSRSWHPPAVVYLPSPPGRSQTTKGSPRPAVALARPLALPWGFCMWPCGNVTITRTSFMTGTSESVSLTPDENRSQYRVPALWDGRLEGAPSGHHAEGLPGLIYRLEASHQPFGAEAVTEEKTEAQRGQATSWRSHSEKWHCRGGPHDSWILKHPVPRG